MRWKGRRVVAAALLCWLVTAGCDTAELPAPPLPALPGTSVAFRTDGALNGDGWLDHPWPSLARLDEGGQMRPDELPDHSGLPLIAAIFATVGDRDGASQMPVAYFRFDHALPELDGVTPLLPDDAPILLLDLDDPDAPSPPLLARTLAADPYVPDHTLAVAPLPGFVLLPRRTYAVVVLRSLGDADGAPLGVPAALRNLLDDRAEAADDARMALLRPGARALRIALQRRGIAADDVAAATFFRTADAHGDLHALAQALRQRDDAKLGSFAVDPDDGAAHERFCELHGSVAMPQYQVGSPPFAKDGLFAIGADGLPAHQRDELVPVVITIPRGTMPEAGWPVVLYLHGSGGLSTQVVDRGPQDAAGRTIEAGRGPAYWLALHGIASVGVALPVNPERLPGAGSTAYINLANLAAFRDTIRQGTIEQGLLLDALQGWLLDASSAAACGGAGRPLPKLPSGASAHRLDLTRLGLMGQSQGGHYAWLVAAVEDRVRVVVPTGAGSFWSHYILITTKQPAEPVIRGLLGTEQPLTWMHPAMAALQLAWEPIETLVAAPRVLRAPIDAAPRDVFQPVGHGDSFYPAELFDALAVAAGTRQAGVAVWDSMQQLLLLAGRAGVDPYPVRGNVMGAGATRSAAVVQFADDGVHDPHGVVYQRPEIQHQVACFFRTGLHDPPATLPAPASPSLDCASASR